MPFDLERYHRLRSSTRVGEEVVYAEVVRSTMDEARTGAAAGRRCGTAYVGGEQTAGRGRQGRTWVSAAAAGLYVTYHLCPSNAARAPLLSIAGGMAAAEAIRAAAGLEVDLKWPNDLLHGDKKLCGILAEAEHGHERLNVYLGIGINLRTSADLPPEVASIATSIEGAGIPAPPPEVLLAALSTHLEGFAREAEEHPDRLVAAWRARLVTLGQRVRLAAPDGEVEGVALDVTSSGELVLEIDGEPRAFAAGDVTSAR